jgi:hypothetical protein
MFVPPPPDPSTLSHLPFEERVGKKCKMFKKKELDFLKRHE